jgi:hypothetical protein
MNKERTITLSVLTILTVSLSSCVKQQETVEKHVEAIVTPIVESNLTQTYGIYTNEIEKMIAATPLGSEIFLEEKIGGGYYLRIEKVFSDSKEKTEIAKLQEMQSIPETNTLQEYQIVPQGGQIQESIIESLPQEGVIEILPPQQEANPSYETLLV